MAKLFISLADSGQVTHQLVGEVITVGRYPDNMIQIDHASVSGHHARLVARNGRYHLQDLNSTPKSSINGMPSRDTDLPGSCVLRFGTVECIYNDEVNASPIDQYVMRLAESQRQVDAVIRARDSLHQQVQDLQKQKDAAVQAGEESAFEVEELRKQLAVLQDHRQDAVPHRDPEPARHSNDQGAPAALNGETNGASLPNGDCGHREPALEVEPPGREHHPATREDQDDLLGLLETAVKERDAISARLADCIDQIAVLTKERDSIQQGAEGLSKALYEAKQQIEAAGRERGTLRKEYDQLTAHLEERQKEVISLQEGRKAAHEDFQQVSARLADALKQNEALPGERDAAQQGNLSGALSEARQKVETISQERDALRARDKASGPQLEEQREKIASLEEERNALAEKLEKQGLEVSILTERCESARNGMESLQEEIASRRENIEPQLEQSRLEIVSLTEQRDSFRRQSEELSASLAETRDQMESLARARGSTRQEVEAIRMDRDSLKEQQADWAARLEQNRNQIASLAAERNQARAAGEKAGAYLAESEVRLRMVTSERDAAVKGALELVETRRQVEELTLERNSSHERARELAARLDQKPGEVEKAFEQFKVAIATKEEEIIRLKEELSAARALKTSAADAPLVSPVPDLEEKAEERPVAARVTAAGNGAETRSVPASLNSMRSRLHYFIRHPDDHAILDELSRHASEIKELSGASGQETSHRLAIALDGMVGDLCERPALVSQPLLRTLSQAVDFLATLQEEKMASKASCLSRGSVFVVDDDPGILGAVVPALERAGLHVSCTGQPRQGLKILAGQKFDLVLLDLGLPEMNGMDLCAKIRELPNQKKTPIFFLTGMDTVQNRVDSMLSGGNDFIGKPFNSWELAAKSLIWVLKGQLSLI